MKTAFFRFFHDDWRRDCACLSPAARGLWIEFIAYAWSLGTPCLKHSIKHFARVLFATDSAMRSAISEWETHKICEVNREPDGQVSIRCRRMARDMEFVTEERGRTLLRAKKAAKSRWEKHASSNAPSIPASNAQAMPSSASSASANGTHTPRVTPDGENEQPTEDEVIAEFARCGGRSEWASKWWGKMEGVGWVANGQPVRKWRAMVPGTVANFRQYERPAPRGTTAAAERGRRLGTPLTPEEAENLEVTSNGFD